VVNDDYDDQHRNETWTPVPYVARHVMHLLAHEPGRAGRLSKAELEIGREVEMNSIIDLNLPKILR